MVDSTVELNPLSEIKDEAFRTTSEVDPLLDKFSSALRADDCSSRLSQYKSRIRHESNQEERRRLLLERQKLKRNAKFNEGRSVKDSSKDGSGDWSKEEDFIENDSVMEWSTVKEVAWYKRGKIYNNMIMFSEWLIDVPCDFTTKWIMVPCPVGKRNLIVSKLNHCTAYSKNGVALYYFKSALPPKTILDCVWCCKTKSFYILDVIQWNGMSLKNCQTDFRFYWLNSKFQENPQYSIKTEENQYPLTILKHYLCNLKDISETVTNYPFFQDNCPKIDGMLFYHSETHYTSGRTPLVGWLKPFMLPDLFGIQINSEYNSEKPEGYVSFTQFMSKKEARKKKSRNNRRKDKMDCEVIEYEDNKLSQDSEFDGDNENDSIDAESCELDSMNM